MLGVYVSVLMKLFLVRLLDSKYHIFQDHPDLVESLLCPTNLENVLFGENFYKAEKVLSAFAFIGSAI